MIAAMGAPTTQKGCHATRQPFQSSSDFRRPEQDPDSKPRPSRPVLSLRLTPEQVEQNLRRAVMDWRRQRSAKLSDIRGLQEQFNISREFAEWLSPALLGVEL